MSETKNAPVPEPFASVLKYFDKQAKIEEVTRDLVRVSAKIIHDDDGSVWMHVPNGAINLNACIRGSITRKAFLDWAEKMDTARREVSAALGGKAE